LTISVTDGKPQRMGMGPEAAEAFEASRCANAESSIRTAAGTPGRAADSPLIALFVVVVAAPQLVGGVFPWAVAATCVMGAAAGIVASRKVEIVSAQGPPARLLDWVMVAALVWTCLQLVPLPEKIVARFVPESVEAWKATALLLGKRARSWIPLSLDPGATRLEIAKGTAIVATYLAARVLSEAGQRRQVLAAVGASGIAMALVAFGHKLANADRVFGLYEPVYASSRLLAPIMNENQLGGFMVMTSPVLLGLAFDAKTREQRIAWGLGAALCSTASVLSFSRGAIGALGFAIAVFVALCVRRLDRDQWAALRAKAVPITVIVALGAVLVVVGVQGTSLGRELGYRHNVTTKFEGAANALPLIASHPIAGVGRGAFSAAFVDQHGTEKRFFYPENLLVQWTSEWGIPVALLVLGVVAWSVFRGFRDERSAFGVGGLAGLAGIGLQQLADFSLELVGIAVVAAATLGAVARSPRARIRLPLRILCVVVSAASVAGATLALTMHGGDVFSLEQRIRDALEAERHAEARALVNRGLALHPSEPIFALSGAELAVRRSDPTAARWLNVAQSLAPLWTAPHLLAARWLFSIGKSDQALVELREAESLQPGSARQTICGLLRQAQDPTIALRTAPEGPAGVRLLDRSARCLPLQSQAAIAIDEEARRLDPNAIGPAARQARRLFLAGSPDDAANLLGALPELDVGSTKILAEAHLRSGNVDAAADAIRPLLLRTRLPSDVLRTAASIFASARDDHQLNRVASRLRALTAGKPEALAEVELFLGGLYEQNQRSALALSSYQSSFRANETREALEAVARTANAVGDRQRALWARRRLCRIDGEQDCELLDAAPSMRNAPGSGP
jgi:tetratricopeptide (TPR) repeat protein